MSKNSIWQVVPYLLPVLSYIIGRKKNKLRVPKPISVLLDNTEVLEVIVRGIEEAERMRDKSNTEKREYVREWARSELYRLLGERLPDSTINYLIEHALIRAKAGMPG